ncbi:eukaryotic mitochondrial regulator protein-domain-containing protein [Mycena epipterygia]|nr:eukaryotic mitochondrial regulator protein-domain-containing protein [Mycena epipterygia]
MLSRARCFRPLCPPPTRRCISSSSPRHRQVRNTSRPSKDEDADEDDEKEEEGGAASVKTFKAFLKVNEKLRIAKPRNWISATPDAPFPMNPSFKPPTPLSDAVRSRIYADYMIDPETNNIRSLSQRYHLSLKRVQAILRLKGLEESFVKNDKRLQTGFRWGMEMLLGVKPEPDMNRADTHAADLLEQDENRDAARQRFQRQFWEVTEDGKDAILPGSLQHAKRVAERHADAAEALKTSPRFMPRFKDTPTIKSPREKVQRVVREGRVPVHFVDVGGRFIDVEERRRRLMMGDRRQAITERRAVEEVLKGRRPARSVDERNQRVDIKRREREERAAAREAEVRATESSASGSL